MIKDLTGKRFGRLVAKRLAFTKNGFAYWECQCDCGKTAIVRGVLLSNENTKSCGCYNEERIKEHIQSKEYKKQQKKFMDRDRFKGTRITTIKPGQKLRCDNTSGVKGVTWDKSKKRWFVRLYLAGKCYNIGRFKNLDDAIKARKEAEEKYFRPVIEEWEEGKCQEEIKDGVRKGEQGENPCSQKKKEKTAP